MLRRVARATDEQIEAVDLFAAGGDLKVFAFAGAGKTRALEMMADEARGPALYLAFNRSIAAEARGRFPPGTGCSTVHGLAFQALKGAFGDDKMLGALALPDLVEILELDDRPFGAGELTARSQAALVRAALDRFLHGTDERPGERHVPLAGALAKLPPDLGLQLVADTAAKARDLWAQMTDPCNPVPLGHDGYLKLWAMERPKLSADHILLDEAQDTNPVVLDVIRAQDAQVVYVGDPHQRIYGWRGAVDVMTAVPAARAAHLTRSFRFGEPIAAAASRVVAALGETRRLEGNPAIDSAIGRCAPDAMIARTNAGVVDAVLDALMIAERPHVVGGTGELLRLLVGVDRLKQGRGADAPELLGFARWGDVVEAAWQDRSSGLGTLVDLVEEHGEDRLIAALGKVAPDEGRADVVVTTAHRAKGREWNRAQLRDDFVGGLDRLDPAEARLFYVALTRARRAVDVPAEAAGFFGIEADAPTGVAA